MQSNVNVNPPRSLLEAILIDVVQLTELQNIVKENKVINDKQVTLNRWLLSSKAEKEYFHKNSYLQAKGKVPLLE